MEFISSVWGFILAGWDWLHGPGFGGFLGTLTGIVGIFATLATITPNDYDNKLVAALLKAIHFLGANFGKAKNAG